MKNENNLNENVILNQNENEQHKRNFIFPIVMLIIIGVIAFFCIKRMHKTVEIETKEAPTVKVTNITKGNLQKETSLVGTIISGDTYYVVPKVSGEILKIYVKNGDEVKKGDKICEIDNSKQVDAARIQLTTAQSAFNRMKKLYQSGDISKQDYESVKAQYDGALLQYNTQVEFSTLISPGDGVVENTNMTLNTLTSQGTVVCYVTSSGAKDVSFGVTERILDGINLGDEVTIEKSGKTYKATISDKANLVSQQTGLFPIKATITSENNFSSGVMCKVSVVYEKKENVNCINKDYVYYDNEEPYVFVVENDSIIKRKFIKTGLDDDVNLEVISGLSKDDKILTTWSNEIMENATVKISK